jgi:ferredoxin-NADP reductase
LPYQFYNSEVIDVIYETGNIRRYIIRIPELLSFPFVAGQFVMLDLPIESKITTRSYSIASAPDNTNIIELLISLKPGGEGTEYLFSKIKKGSTLKVSQAIGKFILPEKIETDICFICTGTGIAPFRSMIVDLINKGQDHKNIFLIFGNRYLKDVPYKEELELWKHKLKGYHFLPVLSREDSSEWKGQKGYVHSIYEELFKEKPEAIFYICGWMEMLKEARQKIAALGYDRSFIKFESYD